MKARKLACIFLLVAGMMGCSKSVKQPEQDEGKELVWWIDKEHAQAPWFKHTKALQDKQYLQNKYTEECNRLLKQHKFPYEVKFRYMNREDSAYASSSDSSYFKKLSKNNEAVDIFMTTQGNFQDMEPMDTYLKEDASGKQLYDAIPAYYWKQNQVNEHIAYVPDIALYDVQMVTGIHKSFAKQTNLTMQDLQTPQSFTKALRSIKDTFGDRVLPLDKHMDIRFLLSDYQIVRSLESSRIAVKKIKDGWKVVDLFQEDQYQAWLKQL